jgi:heptosyltransferase-1
MGDILHALPAVTALRQAHPQWGIDWVVEPRWRALLAAEQVAVLKGRGFSRAAGVLGTEPALAAEGMRIAENTFPQGLKPHPSFCSSGGAAEAAPFQSSRGPAQPLVDHLHLAPTKAWKKAPLSRKTIREIKILRSALRSGNYDAVLDLQGAIRSAVVGRMAGSRRLIGEAEPRERAARRLFTERVTTHGAHVIEQDLELASAVGGDNLKFSRPCLPLNPAAEAWAEQILPTATSKPAVLINPGAGWGAKRWPTERYAAVAQALTDHGLRVLINAGPGEEPLAEAIVQSAAAATPLTCSLDQLIALTRRVALVIAGDTGPLHLACALGRPVVGIYGPTDPSRNGPFGTRFKVLRSPSSRLDHSRHPAPEAGLLTIQPEDVIKAATELLAEENA